MPGMFVGQLGEPFPVGRKVRDHHRDRQANIHEGLKQFARHAAAQPEKLRPQLSFVQNQAVQTVGRAQQPLNVFQTVDP